MDISMGNLLIKHIDKWKKTYYLKEDFTFTDNKNKAAKFYLLKGGDNTTIFNTDYINVNLNNKVLTIDENNFVTLLEREHSFSSPFNTNILVTTGDESIDKIEYDQKVYFITNVEENYALKYDYSIPTILNKSRYQGKLTNYQGKLTNYQYKNTSHDDINSFQFMLEKYTETPDSNFVKLPINDSKIQKDQIYGFKWFSLLVLLIIVLILGIIVNN